MKKRLLCVLTILCLIFTMTPLGAFANTEPVKYNLWVGGVQVTSENADDVFGDGTVSFDGKGYKLTLDNANITTPFEIENYRFGICAIGIPLEIIFKGDTIIDIPDAEEDIYNIGIYCVGAETFKIKKGTSIGASLTINVGSAYYTAGIETLLQKGPYSDPGEFVISGDINITCGDSTGLGSCGISITNAAFQTYSGKRIIKAGSGGEVSIGLGIEKSSKADFGGFEIYAGDAITASAGVLSVDTNTRLNGVKATSGNVISPNGYTIGVLSQRTEGALLQTLNVVHCTIKSGNGGFSCGVSALGCRFNPEHKSYITIEAGESGYDSDGNAYDSIGLAVSTISGYEYYTLNVSGGKTKPGGRSIGLYIKGDSDIWWPEINNGVTLTATGDNHAIFCESDAKTPLFIKGEFEWTIGEDKRYVNGHDMYPEDINRHKYFRTQPAGTAVQEKGTITRLAGADRFGTSAEISKAMVKDRQVDSIVIVDGLNFPDALAAAPFASQENAPILMVNGKTGEIKDTVLAEINRIDADHNAKIYIIGGEGAVSPKAVENLKKLGYKNIERVAGSDRYGTAIEVAKKVDAKTAFIACGLNYPDALGAGSAAALNDGVILFTATGYLTPQTKAYLESEGFEKIVILGGTGAVGDNVEKEIKEICNNVTRISGANRYSTSFEIAKEFFPTSDTIYIATGTSFADALAGGPLAANVGGPIVLVDNSLKDVPRELKEYIAFNGIENVVVLGGDGVVNNDLYTIFGKIVN